MALQSGNYVYVLTNKAPGLEFGKKYIGRTNNLKRRIGEHQSSKLSGKVDYFDFDIILLENNLSFEEAIALEEYWIWKLGTFYNGYNNHPGGYWTGWEPGIPRKPRSTEHRTKLSNSRKGKMVGYAHPIGLRELPMFVLFQDAIPLWMEGRRT